MDHPGLWCLSHFIGTGMQGSVLSSFTGTGNSAFESLQAPVVPKARAIASPEMSQAPPEVP